MVLRYSESGKEDGIPVVLLHAFPLNKNFWQSQLDSLGKEGFRVIAPDLPGFGDSPPLNKSEPSLSDYVDAVLELVDSLDIKDKIVIGGCSWGGYMLFDLWKRHKDRIRGFLFCNTKASDDNEQAKEGRRKANDDVAANGPKNLAENMIGKVFSERMRAVRTKEIEQVKRWILEASPQAIIEGNKAMIARPDWLDFSAHIADLWWRRSHHWRAGDERVEGTNP